MVRSRERHNIHIDHGTYTGYINWQHENDHRWQKPGQERCHCHNDMVLSPVTIVVMKAGNNNEYDSNVQNQRNYCHFLNNKNTIIVFPQYIPGVPIFRNKIYNSLIVLQIIIRPINSVIIVIEIHS